MPERVRAFLAPRCFPCGRCFRRRVAGKCTAPFDGGKVTALELGSSRVGKPVRTWTGLLKGGNQFRPQPLRLPRARRLPRVPALVSPVSRRRCVFRRCVFWRCVFWGSPRTKAPLGSPRMKAPSNWRERSRSACEKQEILELVRVCFSCDPEEAPGLSRPPELVPVGALFPAETGASFNGGNLVPSPKRCRHSPAVARRERTRLGKVTPVFLALRTRRAEQSVTVPVCFFQVETGLSPAI